MLDGLEHLQPKQTVLVFIHKNKEPKYFDTLKDALKFAWEPGSDVVKIMFFLGREKVELIQYFGCDVYNGNDVWSVKAGG